MDPSAFIRDVADRLRRDDGRAEQIVYLVFQEVRAHVTKTRASRVATRLPPAVRALWMGAERYVVGGKPPYQLELFGDVMERGGFADSIEAERAIVAVFTALQELLERVTGAARASAKIFGELPPHLEIFWRAAIRARAPNGISPRSPDRRPRKPRGPP